MSSGGCCSSVVERVLGKDEVMGSSPISSSTAFEATGADGPCGPVQQAARVPVDADPAGAVSRAAFVFDIERQRHYSDFRAVAAPRHGYRQEPNPSVEVEAANG